METNRIIKVKAWARYFEDSEIKAPGGNWHDDDPDCPGIPCAVLDDARGEYYWGPEIDPRTGIILNWKEGWEAKLHYKVCDECEIEYFQNGELICNNEEEYYVPDFLCPNENGYGDYMIMTIDGTGRIQNWSVGKFNQWVRSHAAKVIIPGLIQE